MPAVRLTVSEKRTEALQRGSADIIRKGCLI